MVWFFHVSLTQIFPPIPPPSHHRQTVVPNTLKRSRAAGRPEGEEGEGRGEGGERGGRFGRDRDSYRDGGDKKMGGGFGGEKPSFAGRGFGRGSGGR